MKRISFFLLTMALSGAPRLQAADAATEERLNKLAGQIEGLLETQQAQSKQLDRLAREIDSLREQVSKPTGNYAAQEDLKRVADKVNDVDRERAKEAENVTAQLKELRKLILNMPPPKATKAGTGSKAADHGDSDQTAKNDKPPKPEPEGFEYEIQPGDTLSRIAKNCRESDKKIKVTPDQILKANPGLKADRLIPGKKIIIPVPPQS